MKNFVLKSFGLVLVASTIASVASCNRVQTPVEPGNDVAKIGFVAQIESTDAAKQDAPTRAGAVISKSAFINGDQIGLWVVPFSVTGDGGVVSDEFTDMRGVGNYIDNVLHTYTGGKFIASRDIFYPNAQAKVDLYAVSPYNALMSDRTNNSMADPKAFVFTIAQDQNVAGGGAVISSDIMTAFYRGAKQAVDGKLTFHHRLSRVLIAFNLSDKYKGAAITAVKSVEVCAIPLKSKINVTDTTAMPVIETSNNEGVNIAAYQAVIPNGGVIAGSYQYEAIVTPGVQFVKGDVIVKVTLTVTGLGDVEFLCEAPNAMSYIGKRQTNITLTISDKSAIAFTAVEIQGWGTPIELGVNGAKAALMNFVVDNDLTSRANDVRYAKLGIDDTTYMAQVVLDAGVLRCTYVQPEYRFGEKLKTLTLLKADKTAEVTYNSATPALGSLDIPGDPTSQGYDLKISTLKFD